MFNLTYLAVLRACRRNAADGFFSMVIESRFCASVDSSVHHLSDAEQVKTRSHGPGVDSSVCHLNDTDVSTSGLRECGFNVGSSIELPSVYVGSM